ALSDITAEIGWERPLCSLPTTVLSGKPGFVVPGLAGFRPADAERLTYYPRDLESMIVRV
ncbi:MAG: hypothetical protein QOG89_722, partial [Thermomicrobiales bacterium]|nr:hypothetical protein [Thermomicrobiales bacterium]